MVIYQLAVALHKTPDEIRHIALPDINRLTLYLDAKAIAEDMKL